MITIILANPQMGENIGAAARSMLNFGLLDLRLVNPRDGWPNERAITLSSGAFDVIKPKVFDTLAGAIADLHFTFATTARSRDMVKPEFSPMSAAIEGKTRLAQNQNIGIIFGAERTGLLNDEISQAQAIITIPTSPNFPSINLGQAVLLIAYEWAKKHNIPHALDMGDSFPAKQSEVHSFITRLENDLEERRYFRSEDLRATMKRNIQNIFTRADISDQELRTLHGILSALRGNKQK